MCNSARTSLDRLLESSDPDQLKRLMENDIAEFAVGKWAWIADLQRAGCKPAEIADLIYEGTRDAPWIFFQPSVPPQVEIQVQYHLEGCSHGLEGRIMDLRFGQKGNQIEGPTYANRAIEALLHTAKTQDMPKLQGTERESFVRNKGQADKSTVVNYIQEARFPEHVPRIGLHSRKADTFNEQNAYNAGPATSRTTYLPTDDGMIRRLVEELCGLGGVVPSSRDQRSWYGKVDFSDANSVATVWYFDRGTDLENFSAMAERLEAAVASLQTFGFCCDSFTVLASDGESGSALNLVRIKVSHVKQLVSGLRKQSHVDLHEATHFAAIILSKIWPKANVFGQWKYVFSKEGSTHFCSLALQVLHIGVISYLQAHIGELRPFFLDTPLQQVHLKSVYRFPPIEGQYSVTAAQEELTCLSGMTQDTVVVFSLISRGSQKRSGPFDVQSTPENLLDTWGPGELVCKSKNIPVAIKIGGGYINHKSEGSRLIWSENAPTYHWDGSLKLANPNPPLQLRENILIGYSVRHNAECQNNSSQALQNSSNQLEPLGSYPSYMEVAEYQIGAQGGPESINFIATQTRAKRRGRTIKDDLVEESQGPQRLIENLNSYLAVRVSLCTGVSQRVPLRALFGDLFPAYASTLSSREDIAVWDELQADHRISDRLINAYRSEGEPSPLREWLLSLSHAQLTFIFSVMEQMLKTLKYTGLSPNGKVFSVACPRDAFSRCFEIPLGEETKWATLLADSQKCATFAYITTACLVTDEVSCQCPGSWTNSMPLLETSVLAPTAGQWNLSDGSFYFFINLENDMHWVEARQETNGANRWNTLITVHRVTDVALSWRRRIMGKSWGNQIRERRDHWETALAVSISSARNRLRRQLE